MGIDGDDITPEVEYAAVLVTQLPASSRIARAQNPDNAWSIGEQFLRLIEYELRLLLWGMSDEKKRGEKPAAVMTPAEKDKKQDLIAQAEAVERAVAAAFDI